MNIIITGPGVGDGKGIPDLPSTNLYSIEPPTAGGKYTITATATLHGKTIAATATVYVDAQNATINADGGTASYKMKLDEPYYNGGRYTLKIEDIYIDFSSVQYKDVYMFVYYIPYNVYNSYTNYDGAQLLFFGSMNKTPAFGVSNENIEMPMSFNPFQSAQTVIFFTTNYKDLCINQPLYPFEGSNTIVNYCLLGKDNTYAPFIPGYLNPGYPLAMYDGKWNTKINALDQSIWYNIKYFTDGGQYSPCNY